MVKDKKGRAERLSEFYRVFGQKVLDDVPNSITDTDKVLFDALCNRSKYDILAGAVAYIRFHQDNGTYPLLTWTWLDTNCSLTKLMSAIGSDPKIETVVPEVILDDLGNEVSQVATHQYDERGRAELQRITNAVSDCSSEENDGTPSKKRRRGRGDQGGVSSKRKKTAGEVASNEDVDGSTSLYDRSSDVDAVNAIHNQLEG
ncbi:hypothetical protein Hte_005875 [Hypoxylon texense]